MEEQKTVICPDCQGEIKHEQIEVGDILECGECGCEVEILSLEPLKYSIIMEEK